MPKCKACGKQIKWVEMATGKKMPSYIHIQLDATPRSMVEVKEGIGGVVDVYTPHWATCTNPDNFRRKGKVKVMNDGSET